MYYLDVFITIQLYKFSFVIYLIFDRFSDGSIQLSSIYFDFLSSLLHISLFSTLFSHWKLELNTNNHTYSFVYCNLSVMSYPCMYIQNVYFIFITYERY